jgi:hypothetical protein
LDGNGKPVDTRNQKCSNKKPFIYRLTALRATQQKIAGFTGDSLAFPWREILLVFSLDKT